MYKNVFHQIEKNHYPKFSLLVGNRISVNFGYVERLMQKPFPQVYGSTLVECVIAHTVGHTLVHQRVTHTKSMPTILIIKNVDLWILDFDCYIGFCALNV